MDILLKKNLILTQKNVTACMTGQLGYLNGIFFVCAIGKSILQIFLDKFHSFLIASLVLSPVKSLHSKCFAEPFEKGACDESLRRWSYNKEHETCMPFTYGGCGGSENMFHHREHCIEGNMVLNFSLSLKIINS